MHGLCFGFFILNKPTVENQRPILSFPYYRNIATAATA